MFTVVTHCSQKTCQVLIMGDINLVAYIKYEIDNIMKNVRIWVQAYVNDIICNTKSVFDLFEKLF